VTLPAKGGSHAEEVLKLAFEGGWTAHRCEEFERVSRLGRWVQLFGKVNQRVVEAETIVLDLYFWKGLSVSKGWEGEQWRDEALRFCELILLGEDEEEVGLWWSDLLYGPKLEK
jgi:hypothetical protein